MTCVHRVLLTLLLLGCKSSAKQSDSPGAGSAPPAATAAAPVADAGAATPCARACAHLFEVADSFGTSEGTQDQHERDLRACEQQCAEGRLEPTCVLGLDKAALARVEVDVNMQTDLFTELSFKLAADPARPAGCLRDGAATTPFHGACDDIATNGVCDEYAPTPATAAEIAKRKADCDGGGGKALDGACPARGRIGRCLYANGSIWNHYASGDAQLSPDEARSECEEKPGARWTR